MMERIVIIQLGVGEAGLTLKRFAKHLSLERGRGARNSPRKTLIEDDKCEGFIHNVRFRCFSSRITFCAAEKDAQRSAE